MNTSGDANITGKYILIGQSAVPEPDLLKWANWMETADRIVKQTEVPGGILSTVFLGLDYAIPFGVRKEDRGAVRPLLFETMLFLDGQSASCDRCSTWAEAEEQHERILALTRSGRIRSR